MSIKFLLIISLLYKTEWSWELRTWLHYMNLIDTSTNSPHYLYWKCIGITNENLNFDVRVWRVNCGELISGGGGAYKQKFKVIVCKRTRILYDYTQITKKDFLYSYSLYSRNNTPITNKSTPYEASSSYPSPAASTTPPLSRTSSQICIIHRLHTSPNYYTSLQRYSNWLYHKDILFPTHLLHVFPTVTRHRYSHSAFHCILFQQSSCRHSLHMLLPESWDLYFSGRTGKRPPWNTHPNLGSLFASQFLRDCILWSFPI